MWLTAIISLAKNSAFPFLKEYWKPLFVAFAIICSGIGGCQQGVKWERADWKAKELAASLAAIEIERSNIKTSFEIGSGYEKTKDGIDISFNGYINKLQSDSASITAKTDTTSKPNETARSCGLSQENKRKLLGLAREAELNTQQLISLQQWITEVK